MGVFVPLTAALSNVDSNVPAVMLLRTLVVNFPDPHAGMLTLALDSTMAGTLKNTGSIATPFFSKKSQMISQMTETFGS